MHKNSKIWTLPSQERPDGAAAGVQIAGAVLQRIDLSRYCQKCAHPILDRGRADRTTEKLDHRHDSSSSGRRGYLRRRRRRRRRSFLPRCSSSAAFTFGATNRYFWCSASGQKGAAQEVDGRFILILAISSTAFNSSANFHAKRICVDAAIPPTPSGAAASAARFVLSRFSPGRVALECGD